MINISITQDKELIKSIVTNPVLWDLHGHVEQVDSYVVPENDLWLLIKDNEEIAGVLQLSVFTYITAIAHIYILPEYHGTGTSIEVIDKVRDFLRKTDLKNIVCLVPKECLHVLKLLYASEFKFNGLIEDGIVYHNKLQDLILLQLKV